MTESETPQTVQTAQAEGVDTDLEDLLIFIRDSRGFDFTGYKRTSLARRIRKRMHEAGAASYPDYRDMLESSAEEFNHLFNTILINVTGFFRDADSWAYLQRDVIPEILADAGMDREIRVWSAGCSSGEEAYSLAMAFAEAMGIDECVKRVKIYGTDIDEEALRDARAGMYPARALQDLPINIRDKYFDQVGSHFAFRPDLRRRVIFGRHDITSDAPISRLDLLVCRNTLMYFNVETQSQVIERFHFALRETGYLYLGRAEMLLSDGDRFEVASMRQRIFRRRVGPEASKYHPTPLKFEVGIGPEFRDLTKKRQLRDIAVEAIPFGVLGMNADGNVVLLNGALRSMFGMTSRDIGRPFRDLEISYRPVELRSLIDQAYAEHRLIRVGAVERSLSSEEVQFLDIHIQPMWGSDGLGVGVILLFIDTTTSTKLQREVSQYRKDLDAAYEELQSTNEELETTNEELQSSIEELETTNEELQSTNEELETTNEELQSGNEELETMNDEMRVRTAELDEARTFLEGVLGSMAAGVIVLDSSLRVRSWNKGAEELWGLRSDEVREQNFFDLDFGLPTSELHEKVQNCLVTGRRQEAVQLPAINRIGRSITCVVACSPLKGNGHGQGVVLMMEELYLD
jgi:two-component system CheB/CheR fusion protein